MNKLQRALNVCKDLKTMEFKVDEWEIRRSDGAYSIWVANGFWFIAFYKVDGGYVGGEHQLSKFGALGKVMVYLSVRKWLKANELQTATVFNKIWPTNK